MSIQNLKTPCFIIEKDMLDEGLGKLRAALNASWGNYVIGYSYKTNSLPWVIRYMKDAGCMAEVVSDDEYALAKSVGVAPAQIIYNGLAKSRDSFLEAVRAHAIVNLDAEYEIEWLDELNCPNCEVGVRVNFDLEAKCPGQTQCGEDGERFGFCYENGELLRVIRKIEAKGVRVSGLHMHKSSKTRMPDIYRAIAEVAVEIADIYHLDLKYIDIGGGFFGGLDWKPQFPAYFDMVSRILRPRFDPASTMLVVEPGMALIGPSIDYLSSVVDVKVTTRNTFVVTDGSRTQIDPLMTKSSYFYELLRRGGAERPCLARQLVSGFTCMEHDRIFELLEEEILLPGDQILYRKVGAYTMCLSPLFIKWFPNVYLKSGDSLSIVREKWDTEDYKKRSAEE